MLIVTVVVPLPGSEAGLKLQLLLDGKEEHAKFTVPVNPVCPVIVSVAVALCPAVRVAALELREGAKSADTVTFTALDAEPE